MHISTLCYNFINVVFSSVLVVLVLFLYLLQHASLLKYGHIGEIFVKFLGQKRSIVNSVTMAWSTDHTEVQSFQ